MERVPQYIDVEDRIAGPLTWKQLGWFFGAGGILLLLWNVLEKGAFWIAAIPILLAATAFAFYKPHGVPLINFVGYAFSFVMRPKIYVWQRESTLEQKKASAPDDTFHASHKSQLDAADVEAITKTLDSHGQERSAQIEKLLKERSKK